MKIKIVIGWTMRAALTALILAVLLAGCAAIGRPTVDRDRFDYVSAISASWKRQTLLNLVKTRYLDAPVFMDVASVISQYALEGEIEWGFTWQDRNTQTLGGRGTYTDRPTITYNPLMGEKFARSLLRPIPIPAILLLIQSGYPADYMLRICVQAINGLENLRSSPIAVQEADPEFYELLDVIRSLQKMDGMAMRSKSIDNRQTMVMIFRQPKNEVAVGNLKRSMQLLGLDAELREFNVVHGGFASDNKEIAILSRSLLQVMVEYAAYIDVPESDISDGRVLANKQEAVETEARLPPLIRVHNGTLKPDKAFVAVPYRNHWFWINDRDIYSKAMFQFLMTLFSFTERGESERTAPVITVPTN
ncbi:MAG: hypothetical protein JRF62_00415 [Deltaproteobacteria bacterium]|nr:hypothetical protein [Deltaproteobacteria bacterium]MBW2638588.1 hypothetical protein [Deltaproteobacteria bacterium]MBW2679887.1 hypothetical protein [Deltaproteobacteria bacterium]RLC17996.1 MAG: hypothetical protein DRI24_04315 [Deltaproteobacteria bacterium]